MPCEPSRVTRPTIDCQPSRMLGIEHASRLTDTTVDGDDQQLTMAARQPLRHVGA